MSDCNSDVNLSSFERGTQELKLSILAFNQAVI